MKQQTRRMTASVAALLMLCAAIAPARAGAPADDLKQIEYKYYFRGKYPQAIEALQTFLARVDATGDVALRAGEFLAASHVLSGTPVNGKDVFARIITTNPTYAGPDAAVFKPEVMNVYEQARSEYASLTLKNAAPVVADTLATSTGTSTPAGVQKTVPGKPIYKKWWFYAGAAAVVGVIAGVAGGGDNTPPPASGTVSVGVVVH